MPAVKPVTLNGITMNAVNRLSHGLCLHAEDQAFRYINLGYWEEMARSYDKDGLDVLISAATLGVVCGGCVDGCTDAHLPPDHPVPRFAFYSNETQKAVAS